MNDLNSVLLEGRLVKDAVLQNTVNGGVVCEFIIASNRFYKTGNKYRKKVSFFDIEAWEKLAAVSECLKKGCGVKVVGRLKQDRWKDNDDKIRTKIVIVAEHIDLKKE